MIPVLLQFIPLALAALTPTMVMFVLALLPTEHGPLKALSVVIGRYIAHFGLAIAFVFFIGKQYEEAGQAGFESELISIVLLIIGVSLVVMAVSALLSDEPEDRPPSRVATLLNSVSPVTLGAVNFLVVLLSLRLMAVVAAGSAIIVSAEFGNSAEVLCALALAGAMVLGIATPLFVYVALGKRGTRYVEQMRVQLQVHRRKVEFAVLAFFGGLLIVTGLNGL